MLSQTLRNNTRRPYMFQTPSERGGIVLKKAAAASGTASASFKPLQNGAVLCCPACGDRVSDGQAPVSNPFRTGRYCADGTESRRRNHHSRQFQTPSERGGIVLRQDATIKSRGIMFQTPSERGGIVLRRRMEWHADFVGSRFKPLQNGAVLCWSRTS